MVLEYKVKDKDAGKTVQTILRRELLLSASMVRRLKNVKGIYSNGLPVYTTHVLSPGETVLADITAAEPQCDVLPQSGYIESLYESEGLLAVNKPAGVIVHPSHAKYDGTLSNFVSGYLLKKHGDGRCHTVNRLDRDTSGAVLFAKNAYFKERASSALSTGSKEYLALVSGVMPQPSGIIDIPIKRLREGELLRVPSPDGQRAVTIYETVKTGEISGRKTSLLRLRLETGRTHQIRVHCLASGCPLLGDIMYYTDDSRAFSQRLGLKKQCLHASRLVFEEPLTGKGLDIHAPLTRRDMLDIIEAL